MSDPVTPSCEGPDGEPFTFTGTVQVMDADPPYDRYQFSLEDGDGNKRDFIIDLYPAQSDHLIDVWVQGCTIEVGDTPEDGFASFTPKG